MPHAWPKRQPYFPHGVKLILTCMSINVVKNMDPLKQQTMARKEENLKTKHKMNENHDHVILIHMDL